MNQYMKVLYSIAVSETEGEEAMVEMLAELIIEKCVDIAEQNNNSGEGKIIAAAIYKHFYTPEILRQLKKGVMFTEYNEEVSKKLWLDLGKASEK